MKTFEGTMTIKWHKNDNGDRRALTIDVEDRTSLDRELSRIRHDFMTFGDDMTLPGSFFKSRGTTKEERRGKLPYNVSFDISERK